jgi:hypothetical protein
MSFSRKISFSSPGFLQGNRGRSKQEKILNKDKYDFFWFYQEKISSVFGSVVVCAFQITFRAKIHANNIFFIF